MNLSDAKSLFQYINNSGYKLTSWEADFLQQVEYQIVMKYKISKKQGEWLQLIYRKSVGGGVYQAREYV